MINQLTSIKFSALLKTSEGISVFVFAARKFFRYLIAKKDDGEYLSLSYNMNIRLPSLKPCFSAFSSKTRYTYDIVFSFYQYLLNKERNSVSDGLHVDHLAVEEIKRFYWLLS